MKDYYYILGIKNDAKIDDIKVSYRKLCHKFHPDKNGGDEFFTERFKEINEAYEILTDISRKNAYDVDFAKKNSSEKVNHGYNFEPVIEYFRVDKVLFDFNEEITFSWKTINADKVKIKPFGVVKEIGQKTYRIKDFKNKSLTFELTAENSNIARQKKTSLTLINQTYIDLYAHFKEIFLRDQEFSAHDNQSPLRENKNPEIRSRDDDDYSVNNTQIAIIIGIVILVTILLSLLHSA